MSNKVVTKKDNNQSKYHSSVCHCAVSAPDHRAGLWLAQHRRSGTLGRGRCLSPWWRSSEVTNAVGTMFSPLRLTITEYIWVTGREYILRTSDHNYLLQESSKDINLFSTVQLGVSFNTIRNWSSRIKYSRIRLGDFTLYMNWIWTWTPINFHPQQVSLMWVRGDCALPVCVCWPVSVTPGL